MHVYHWCYMEQKRTKTRHLDWGTIHPPYPFWYAVRVPFDGVDIARQPNTGSQCVCLLWVNARQATFTDAIHAIGTRSFIDKIYLNTVTNNIQYMYQNIWMSLKHTGKTQCAYTVLPIGLQPQTVFCQVVKATASRRKGRAAVAKCAVFSLNLVCRIPPASEFKPRHRMDSLHFKDC